ncbi:MAG TPA: hypothetical protein VGG05_07565 [Pseudonocardiaceae bacterium]
MTTTPDGRWLTISVTEGTGRRTDLWLADLSAADPAHRPIVLRTERGVGHSLRAMSRGIGVVGETLAFLGTELGLTLGGAPAGPGSGELVAASRRST